MACTLSYWILASICFLLQDLVDDFRIEKSAAINLRSPVAFTNLNIGEIQAGTKGSLIVTLANNTETAFRIAKIEVGCSCISVKSFGNVIPAGESVKFDVAISAPKNGVMRKRVEQIRIIETDESAIQLAIIYELAGTAGFGVLEVSPTVPIGDKVFEFRVPIFMSKPVTPKDVSIRGTGDLVDLKAEIVAEGDGFFATCKLPIRSNGPLAIGGELQIEVPVLAIKNSIPCFISRQSEVVLMPTVVRFELKDKTWIANATIRDNRKSDQRSDDLAIACQGEKGVKIQVEQMKVKGLYRVTLTFPNDPRNTRVTFPAQLNWQVAWDGGIAEFSSRAIHVE